MLTRVTPGLLALLTLAITACSTPQERTEPIAGVSPLGGVNTTSGVVLSGPDLYEHGGTLLAFLYARIAGMSVDYSSQPCPNVQIRSRKSLLGSNSPIVYVDGARAANSCVLEMLHTRDLSSVEVYPMGVSNRPGYEAHPNGLILVFVRDGLRERSPRQGSQVSE